LGVDGSVAYLMKGAAIAIGDDYRAAYRRTKEIWIAEITYKELQAEHQKIRDEIHAYIDKHDLQWARNWGW
jgi:hypothetical protein